MALETKTGDMQGDMCGHGNFRGNCKDCLAEKESGREARYNPEDVESISVYTVARQEDTETGSAKGGVEAWFNKLLRIPDTAVDEYQAREPQEADEGQVRESLRAESGEHAVVRVINLPIGERGRRSERYEIGGYSLDIKILGSIKSAVLEWGVQPSRDEEQTVKGIIVTFEGEDKHPVASIVIPVENRKGKIDLPKVVRSAFEDIYTSAGGKIDEENTFGIVVSELN